MMTGNAVDFEKWYPDAIDTQLTTLEEAKKKIHIMNQLGAYIAGPLFNEHERWYLEEIDAVVRSCGLNTFLPHRDTNFKSEEDIINIFDTDVEGLIDKDLIVALLDGQDIDSGTCTELGIAYCNGITAVGITTDIIRRSYSNAMPYGVCLKSLGVVHSLDELKNTIVDWLKSRLVKVVLK